MRRERRHKEITDPLHLFFLMELTNLLKSEDMLFQDEISGLNPLASPYAKMTPTGVDPKLAAQRAKVDWDAAAEIQPGEEPKDLSDMVPPVVVSVRHLIFS